MNLNGFPLSSAMDSLQGGSPFSNANRIRLIEAPTLSRWPSSPSGWDSPQGVPPPLSLQRMGFASRGSPSLYPRGSLLQVDEILLKGLPSPQRMGFASRESPSQQRMGFASRGSPSPKRMGFASRGSPSPKRMGFAPRGSPSPKRMGFAWRGSPSPKRMGFASRGSPSPKWMGFVSDAGPSCSKRPLSRDSPSPRPRYSRDSLSPKGFASSPKRMGFASRDSPSPKRQRFESRDSDSPRRQHSSRASSREASVERPQSRSSPTHPYSPSREDKEAEDTSMPAPVKAMIDFGSFTEQGPGFPLSAHFYQRGHCYWEVTQVMPWVSQLSHLVGDGFDSFSSWEETSA